MSNSKKVKQNATQTSNPCDGACKCENCSCGCNCNCQCGCSKPRKRQ